ncbi:class I SAM-dependent methyltransferase [Lichenicoccus sp.]|uniref:class I SAM-dependent methyltransferase n=1 Tax=Lichenicoccus sp. TaxID=2781899 RepID=UPI003D0E3F37
MPAERPEDETGPASLLSGAPHPVLAGWYGKADARAGFVRRLFDAGAPDYDRLNRLFSFNSGAGYRARTLRGAGLRPGDRVLDVATGTGLVAREALRIVQSQGLVVGLDLSAGMLAVAAGREGLALVMGDAGQLPICDAGFDMVTMGYALRHVADLRAAFAGFRRVLRPGGTLVLMEIASPPGRIRRRLARLYLSRLVPLLGRLTGGGAAADRMMRYYWDTIEHCVPEAVILASLAASGFAEARCDTQFGLLKTYTARRALPVRAARGP